MDEKKGTDGRIDRRRKNNVRKKVYQFRMNDEEDELLESLSIITDEPRSDVIRNALKLYDKVKRAGGNY